MDNQEQDKPKTTTAVVSFRLGAAAHAKLNAQVEASNRSPREWLEKAILENRTTIIARQKPHKDLRALLFQISRAGNNINQLAHKFNLLDKMGQLGPGEYDTAVSRLDEIAGMLREALDHAR
jgi:hypothetical protein